MSDDRISHTVVLNAAPAAAFNAFATHLGAWWPLSYTFSGSDFAGAMVEPRVGGTWFERQTGGTAVPWGEVRVYEPPERLVLGFAIGADRKPASNDDASEVEVRFSAEGRGRTRVEVEHRNFARHGEGADVMRTGMDSPQGWPLILAELKRWIAARPATRYIVASIDPAVAFYTSHLGFVVDMRPAPGFAALSRGPLLLYLNEPGAGGSGAAAADGTQPEPGGWNRVQLVVADLAAHVQRLRDAGCQFRREIVEGQGGNQALVEDPSGNVVELFEPRRG